MTASFDSINDSSGALLALSNSLADAIEQAGQAVVAVNARHRHASSGVHWQQGIIVTAEHTVKRDEEITIVLADGRTLAATLVGRDAGTDLAVLKLEDSDLELPIAPLGEVTLRVGSIVLAVGRSTEGSISASMGIISSLGGTWRTWHGGQIDQFIRPALTVYPGFSGGPLVSPQGQVVGINTAGPRSMALTIPASTVNRVVNQLLRQGRIARGYLGVGMQAVRLPDRLQQSLSLTQSEGVIIVSVEPDSPADQAGILIGDIVVALDNQPISDISEVHTLLDPDRVGIPLHATVVRGGAIAEITVTVGERPWRKH
jgi:S1-C subfamily serine protease